MNTLGVCIRFPYLKLKASIAKLLHIIYNSELFFLYVNVNACALGGHFIIIWFLNWLLSLSPAIFMYGICYISFHFLLSVYLLFRVQMYHLKALQIFWLGLIAWIPTMIPNCLCFVQNIWIRHSRRNFEVDLMEKSALSAKVTKIPYSYHFLIRDKW